MATSLHDLLENSNFEEALNLINSEIKTYGIQPQLIQAKLYCLINMSKFTLALSTIDMARKSGYSSDAFVFESAYCLYRLGKFLSALNLIEKSIIDSRLMLLKGQVLYRLERFNEAVEIFKNLLKNEKFSPEELIVNLLASKSQAKIDHDGIIEPSFDSSYNLALIKFATNDFKAAEKIAEDCEKFLESGNASQSDLINAKLVSTCALMAEKDNWPEAEFILRKLKTSNGLSSLQDNLITANLLAVADKKKTNIYSADFDINMMDKISLFRSQKQQILANAYSYGIEISHGQKRLIEKKSENQMEDIETQFIEVLKKNKPLKTVKKQKQTKETRTKKVSNPSKPLDKERWMPLRDRSYYKPKAKYLKSISVKKSSSKK